MCQGLLPTIRHFENRQGEGPGDEVEFYHNLPLFSPYHAARINVSRNAFLNSRSEEKTFSLAFVPGKNKSKGGFVVCNLIDNGYDSLLSSKTLFPYCFCMLREFAKVFERKADAYK